MKIISRTTQQTRAIAADFAKKTILEMKSDRPLLIGLMGDLGAGKTTFVQGMAQGLGIDPDYYVNSPTFTLVNEYRLDRPLLKHLIHIDLYRIENPQAAENLALEDYLSPGHLVVVEWPEKWPRLLQQIQIKIEIHLLSPKEREIVIEKQPLETFD